MTPTISALHLCDSKSPIAFLEAKKHFDALTDREKLYAHHLAQASWHGFEVMVGQLSHESPALIKLLSSLFRVTGSKPPVARSLSEFKEAANVSEEAWTYFVEYAVQTLYNGSNFRSYGDTKFIPRVSRNDFSTIVERSGVAGASEEFRKLEDYIYGTEPAGSLHLGYPDELHVSGYYSKDVTKAQIDLVKNFLDSQNLLPLNTRIFTTPSGLKVLIASSKKSSSTHKYEGVEIEVEYGDFANAMSRAAESARHAATYSANETQRLMLEAYAESFETGDMDRHKDSQRHWIKDIGPVVETNIGFVETYRDPSGVRAEWEGFVAVVNKEMTAKFERLVNGAGEFIKRLPWGPHFEKDKFNRPDFTSLEVVSFATAGSPPLGINIPNYDDIRMTEGFKNVSLGNVANTPSRGEVLTFLTAEDEPLFKRYRGDAFEVQVGLHELLGHGSGKLLQEEPAGTFNFDKANAPIHPFTGRKVESWYGPGETWGSRFGSIASAYEECRAEAVAMALIDDKEILEIFHIKDEAADDVIYVGYLQMARMGFMALEFYDPNARKWGQAHAQARHAILRVLIDNGVAKVTPNADHSDALVTVDRAAIIAKGVPAIKQFLLKLHTYKAIGDAAEGVPWFRGVSSVEGEWLKLRDIVIKKKQPRKVIVQGNTFLAGESAIFKEYPATSEGFIQSFIERDLIV